MAHAISHAASPVVEADHSVEALLLTFGVSVSLSVRHVRPTRSRWDKLRDLERREASSKARGSAAGAGLHRWRKEKRGFDAERARLMGSIQLCLPFDD